jgi:hypothetical protein
MSKALVYGVLSSIAVIGASATYFFPVIENINSFIQGETNEKTIEKEIVATNDEESNYNNLSTPKSTNINPDNPRVILDDDSIKEQAKKKEEYSPFKAKILESEIPVTKNY